MRKLFNRGFEKPEDEARAYFLMGHISLKTGDDDEALRMFSQSRNAMKTKQTELYNKILWEGLKGTPAPVSKTSASKIDAD